jgi:hypothetical protein
MIMKKITFLLQILFVLNVSTMFAQTIINNGFESWSNNFIYENPAIYETSNFHIYNSGGELNAMKTTDAQEGDFALQLTTKEAPEINVNGMAFIGYPGEDKIFGGIPFNKKPNQIKVWVKYDIKPLDTANIIVIFKTSTAFNGYARAQLTGTQEDYQEITIFTQWFLPYTILPDTMAVVLTSSNINTDADLQPGSTITIDNIRFGDITDDFPNGSFEEWEDTYITEPDSWITSNAFTSNSTGASVMQSEDSYEGESAAEIITQKTIWGDLVAFIANCYVGKDDVYGGIPVDQNPIKVKGFYKYNGVDSDSALFFARLSHYNEDTQEREILEEVYLPLGNTDEYLPFEIPFTYATTPDADTLSLVFSSSNYNLEEEVRLGSSLLLDSVFVQYFPNVVDESLVEKNIISPNPAYEQLRFNLANFFHSKNEIRIYNASGKLVKKMQTSPATMSQSVDVSDLSAGLYFYELSSGDQSSKGKFIIK